MVGKSCWNSLQLMPYEVQLEFQPIPSPFCWFKGLNAEDLLGCSEHRGPRLSTGATKKGGVEVVSFSMESWEICLKKTVDVLKFSIKFKFQFSVWMTLPNLRFDNSFWPFQRILISFNFGCLKYEFVCDGSILIRLVNCGNVQDLVKSVVVAGGTSMLLNLAPRLRSVWLLLREKMPWEIVKILKFLGLAADWQKEEGLEIQ